jgi:hypothetical protein
MMNIVLGADAPIKPQRSTACFHLSGRRKPAVVATLGAEGTTYLCSECFITQLNDLLRERHHEEPEQIATRFRFDKCSHQLNQSAERLHCPRCFRGITHALIKYSSLLYFTEKGHAKQLRRVLYQLGKKAGSLSVMDAATKVVSQRMYSPFGFRHPENITEEAKRYRKYGIEFKPGI